MRTFRLLAAAIALAGACGDANLLPDPFLANVEDTVVVYAISGTEVFRPSGYAMTERRAVRLDVVTNADFAYDRMPDGRNIFLPGAAVGQPGNTFDPGLQETLSEYDAIRIAVVNGYTTRDTVDARVGNVYYLRSRVPIGCFFGLPAYGKLQILSFDPEARTVTFKIIANLNCGYRGLELGVPTQ